MRIFYAVCLFLFLLPAAAYAAAPPFVGRVVAIADGDTITVLAPGKQQIKIRLYGIDCPESGQSFGARATQATSEAVHGSDVSVAPMDTDRYGRLVAVIMMPDGRSLNAHLVHEGLAWVYPQFCKHKAICEKLRALEHEAMLAKRGLWADKEPVPPWLWRKARKK